MKITTIQTICKNLLDFINLYLPTKLESLTLHNALRKTQLKSTIHIAIQPSSRKRRKSKDTLWRNKRLSNNS